MKLNSLIKNIVQYKNDFSGININKLCTNSKDVDRGSLFIAIDGAKNDGHDFIDDAINTYFKERFFVECIKFLMSRK